MVVQGGTDDRFQDDKKGGPILTERALSSRPSYRKDGAGGAHLPGKMGPGGPDRRGAPKFFYTGITRQQRIDSKIYRIEIEDIIALDLC